MNSRKIKGWGNKTNFKISATWKKKYVESRDNFATPISHFVFRDLFMGEVEGLSNFYDKLRSCTDRKTYKTDTNTEM